MPWVMAAMAAAQMVQGAQNAAEKRKVDAAGIRYSPWTKISQLPYTPDTEAQTALQGYAGVTGQMQNEKRSKLEDAYLESLTKQTERDGGTTKIVGGSFMNDPQYHQSGYGALPDDSMVRGYDKGAASRGLSNNPYANANLWQKKLAGAY